MSKDKAKQIVESYGATVIRTRNRLGKVVVTISWRDYLKVREQDLGEYINLCLI